MFKICCHTCKREMANSKSYPCVKCLDTFWLNQWEPKIDKKDKRITKEGHRRNNE